MGVLCLGALHPSLFGKSRAGGWLGLGIFLLFSLLCCSPDVHSCCASCVLLMGSSPAAKGLWQQWWELGSRARAWRAQGIQPPAALAGAAALALLNPRPCTQPTEKAEVTCPKGKEAAHGASPICLSQFPPVAVGRDVCCHTIL